MIMGSTLDLLHMIPGIKARGIQVLGIPTIAGIRPHLGKKPKLGGRYTGITHSLHITIASHLYILVSLLWVVSLSVILFQ
jgi:hypothetical protein